MDVMAPVRFNSVEQFERSRSAVNEKLLLFGYEVRADGKVCVAVAATTVGEAQQRADDLRAELSRRNVHSDIIDFCRPELLEKTTFMPF
jgi:hypothetical protein